MNGKRILLVIGGGIAAYKACELVRLIRKAGGGVAQDAMDIVSSEGRKKPCIPVMKKPTLKESLDMNIDGLMSQ